jgi:hypothetical protein
MESIMSLDSRFEKFMLSLPSVEGIDFISLENNEEQSKKADYFGMGRNIIFEQKCINQEQSDRIQKELEKYIDDENYPLFYGKRDFNLVIDSLPNNEEIKRKVFSQITKLLESYLSQSNKQIESTRVTFEVPNSLGVLIILNEKVKILSPEVVSSRLQQRMQEKKGGNYRFNNIDYIIFISETHQYKGVPVIITIEGAGAQKHQNETSEYIDYIINSWAQYNGGGLLEFNNNNKYLSLFSEKKDPIPQKETSSEARAIWYRKNRYMVNWSDEQVSKSAAKHIDTIQPYVLKGGPKLPSTELGELMMEFSDYIEESNIRGLDLKELKKCHEV